MAAALLTMLAGVLAGVGCKKTEGQQQAGSEAGVVDAAKPLKVLESCDQREGQGVCVDYTRTDVGMHRTLCEGYKGKFAELPCPTDKLVGSCLLEDGEFKRYYEKDSPKAAGYTLEAAKTNCESEILKGKFTAKGP